MVKRSKNFGFILPTPEEDAAIAAGIAADPDTYEVPTEEIAAMRPMRGRPRLEQPKASLTMRIDADTLDALKATGPGWQTRVNDLLRKAVKSRRV
jgi:uncharacterized protein (DUF4415 family)